VEKHPDYAALGLKALRRAAAKVVEDANRKKYKLPYWEDGKIVYKIPPMPHEPPFDDFVTKHQGP